MLYLETLTVFSIIWLVSDVSSQCQDCSKLWKVPCETNVTGYYCDKRANIVLKPVWTDEYRTESPMPPDMYADCTPYPYEIINVESWCCIYSRDLGCTVAVHPLLYTYAHSPKVFCENCRDRCMCQSFKSGVSRYKSWNYIELLLLTLLAGLLT